MGRTQTRRAFVFVFTLNDGLASLRFVVDVNITGLGMKLYYFYLFINFCLNWSVIPFPQ